MQFPAKRWIRPQIVERALESATQRVFGKVADTATGSAGSGMRLGIGPSPIVDRLLTARGVPAGAARDAFCRPQLAHLQHPREMHGMVEAAQAICEAIKAGRRIAIYGDYDVDGIMSTAIVWHMLRVLAPKATVRTYIPHRIEEGYGLNADALRTLRAEGIDVVITVDCGVAAIEEAKLAAEIGLELIITDHHELSPSGEVPEARAAVHPRLKNQGTGDGVAQRFGDLCGAGVAWKLAWMLAETWCGPGKLPDVLRERLKSLLPLASIGTIADVVPLRDENRVIVSRGLTEVFNTGIVGLDALLASARLEQRGMDAEKIAFRLAPRINACGRMGHAEDAVELFTTAGPKRADEIAGMLQTLNDKRREEEQEIFKSALAQVAERYGTAKPRGIVLYHDEWNLGIVGIVCSKLVDIHACPVVIFTRNKDIYKGSGRSVPGIELHKVLAACSAHLAGFGGHAMAAGVKATDPAQIEAFAAAFGREVDQLLPPADEQKVPIEIDCVCSVGDLDLPTVQEIQTLAPFGRDNRKPLFLLEDVEVTQVRMFGKTATNLEITVRQQSGRGPVGFLRAQWWDGAKHAGLFARGTRVDLVVEAGLDSFRNLTETQARVVDIRIAQPAVVGAAVGAGA
jgi:single-stranded-DNA-specific exonuclease